MFQLNHDHALTRGKFRGSCFFSTSVIQAAFEPPHSLVAVSAIMIGLEGASLSSSSYVGFISP